MWVFLSWSFLIVFSFSWSPQHLIQQHTTSKQIFKQRTDRFWEYEQQSNSWVEVNLPFDLVSCINDNCTKVGTIDQATKINEELSSSDVPETAGPAVSVVIVNQTILALSESGNLYQLKLSESSQPVWVEITPMFDSKETEESSTVLIKSALVSYDVQRTVYFSTMNGSLLELSEVEPLRWINHLRPPGGDVAAIADASTMKQDVVFIVSSTGHLYEYDRNSKPSWKKHIWIEGTIPQETLLIPSTGCNLHNLVGAHSLSLFLLTKAGYLVERRMYQRKWKWRVHGGPKDHRLTSITPVAQGLSESIVSMFFTTASGSIFEYRLPKHSGAAQANQIQGTWVNHMHPVHTKAASGIQGLQFQIGRILFPLDDGRLAELHFLGIRGEGSGTNRLANVRRKPSLKYEWSVLDAPETEGWNTVYCTEERGPSNCITGVRDGPNESETKRTTRRKLGKAHQTYLVPSISDSSLDKPSEQNSLLENKINTNFHLRTIRAGRSFFLITDSGFTFEYLYAETMWLWLRHEYSTSIKGVLGNYNGSVFLVDIQGNLLIRERNGNELAWINCTALKRGRQVIGGPPWDGMPGKGQKFAADDALFFVSKHGRLLQFTVSPRKFKWKDCRNPLNTKIASIVDQEIFRANILFIIGRNGRLYQYNKLTEVWHEHYQSPHLILSRLPGTAMRLSSLSLMGSLFMVADDGGLIEYHWDPSDGWNWVEHGTPYKTVTLDAAPGPCVQSNQLFLIGSDGKVYMRHLDQARWKWKCYGFPSIENMSGMDQNIIGAEDNNDKVCESGDVRNSFEKTDPNRNCDAKVAPIRPIPFSEDSVIFELRDGRLAELRRIDDAQWVWTHTISTPTSLCLANY